MTHAPRTPAAVRLASFALAALLTLTTLAGIDVLASVDAAAPQLAQGAHATA